MALSERFDQLGQRITDPKSILHVDGLLVSATVGRTHWLWIPRTGGVGGGVWLDLCHKQDCPVCVCVFVSEVNCRLCN